MSYEVEQITEGLTFAGDPTDHDRYKVTDTEREMIYHVWDINHPTGETFAVVVNQQTKKRLKPGGATHTAIVEAIDEHLTPEPEPEPEPEPTPEDPEEV